MSDERPFQKLDDRLAGLPVDRTLHEGVPKWLGPPLRSWLFSALDEQTAQRVALRLQLTLMPGDSYRSMLANAHFSQLLTVVDATLQLHPGWDAPPAGEASRDARWTVGSFGEVVLPLQQALLDAGSAYRIDPYGRCLVRRVDETVQEATDATLKAAPKTAASHLRAAWVAAYGLDPEPDKVFNEAIRAVEELACPLVEPNKAAASKATLGTVIGELKNAGHRWELVLPGRDGQPRDVNSLVAMMETLWDAQRSRHGGGANSRRQTQEEAETVAHLAVLLVQWFNSGALRKKS